MLRINFKMIMGLIICGIFLVFPVTSSSMGDLIPSTTAEKSVQDFIGNFQIQLVSSGTQSYAAGEYYIISTKDSEFRVNAETGVVEAALFYNSLKNGKTVQISQTNAESIGKQFAEKYYKNFTNKNMILQYSVLQDTGYANEYYIYWREVISDVESPNNVFIAINANTGDIISYVGIERTVTVPLNPKISKTEAINIALQQFANHKFVEQPGVKLQIWYDNQSVQHLEWRVNFIDESSKEMIIGGDVIIDAITGEVLSVEQYC
jgi:Zn-dependent metalloprotease